MLIITAVNITDGVLAREDGTSDYEVCAGVNERCFFKGYVKGHIRDNGAAELLRKIADTMDSPALPKTSFGQLAAGEKKK